MDGPILVALCNARAALLLEGPSLHLEVKSQHWGSSPMGSSPSSSSSSLVDVLLPSPCPCQGAPEQQPGSQRSKEQRAGFARGHGSTEVRDEHCRAEPRLPRPAARGEEAETGPAFLLLRVYHST